MEHQPRAETFTLERVEKGRRRGGTRGSPVDGEHHLVRAGLDLALGLQVSHALGGVPVDGQDHVPRAQVGLGRFAAGRHLRARQPISKAATSSPSATCNSEIRAAVGALSKAFNPTSPALSNQLQVTLDKIILQITVV